jgi:hypothetical protein
LTLDTGSLFGECDLSTVLYSTGYYSLIVDEASWSGDDLVVVNSCTICCCCCFYISTSNKVTHSNIQHSFDAGQPYVSTVLYTVCTSVHVLYFVQYRDVEVTVTLDPR